MGVLRVLELGTDFGRPSSGIALRGAGRQRMAWTHIGRALQQHVIVAEAASGQSGRGCQTTVPQRSKMYHGACNVA